MREEIKRQRTIETDATEASKKVSLPATKGVAIPIVKATIAAREKKSKYNFLNSFVTLIPQLV
jgi:hypothetical protein